MYLTRLPQGEALFTLTYHHRHGSDTAVTLAPLAGGPQACVPAGEDPQSWLVSEFFDTKLESMDESLDIVLACPGPMPRLLSPGLAQSPVWVSAGQVMDLGVGGLGEATVRWAYNHLTDRLVAQVHQGSWEPLTPGEMAALAHVLDDQGWQTPPEGVVTCRKNEWPTWA